MSKTSIRDLSRHTTEVLRRIDEEGTPAVVTRNGVPKYVIASIDDDAWEDYVLANAPEFVKSISEAEREIRDRETTSVDSLKRELGD